MNEDEIREHLKDVSKIHFFIDIIEPIVVMRAEKLNLPENIINELKSERYDVEIWKDLDDMSTFTSHYTEDSNITILSRAGKRHNIDLKSMKIDYSYNLFMIDKTFFNGRMALRIMSDDFQKSIINTFLSRIKNGSNISRGYDSKFNFESMDRNVFNTIVKSGALSGKDLLSVCTVNKKVSGWCDQNFYKIRLEDEFGRTVMKLDPSIDYKQLYKNMQLTYWYDFNSRTSISQNIDKYDLENLERIFGVETMKEESIQKYKAVLASTIYSKIYKIPGINLVSDIIGLTYLGQFVLRKKPEYIPHFEFENALDFMSYDGRYYILTRNNEVYRSAMVHGIEIINSPIFKDINQWEKIASDTIKIIRSYDSKNITYLSTKGQFFRGDGNFRQKDFDIDLDNKNIKIIEAAVFDGYIHVLYLNKNKNPCVAKISNKYKKVSSNEVETFTTNKYKVKTILSYETSSRYLGIHGAPTFHTAIFVDVNNKIIKMDIDLSIPGDMSVEYNEIKDLTRSTIANLLIFSPDERPFLIYNKEKYELPFKNARIYGNIMKGQLDL
tara:strand:- start:3440 stop:5098 length:1659 start_codon:yes stop_codon:yes gene_type:complete